MQSNLLTNLPLSLTRMRTYGTAPKGSLFQNDEIPHVRDFQMPPAAGGFILMNIIAG